MMNSVPPLTADSRPRLRPGLSAAVDRRQPQRCILFDERIPLPTEPVLIPRSFVELLNLCDGSRTLRDIQAEHLRRSGELVALDELLSVVQRVDEGLFLLSPRFQAFLDEPDRLPACLGCYPSQAEEIRPFLAELFLGPGGPGLPDRRRIARPSGDRRLRAALVPHIDYQRGGVCYGWSFKEIAENTDARLFVIIATSHYSPARFSLTRKNFRTRLGTVPTDQQYIDRLVEAYGPGLFDDPFAHLPEHSIELEVLLLQYLFEDVREIRIVPLLVGSFFDCVRRNRLPSDQPDIARMIAALQAVEKGLHEPICYIISGDLAHIGPKFADPAAVTAQDVEHSRQQDYRLLHALEAGDAAAYVQIIHDEQDQRRICGYPPTLTTLCAASLGRGRLLNYAQYVHPTGFESVSFAGVGFSE